MLRKLFFILPLLLATLLLFTLVDWKDSVQQTKTPAQAPRQVDFFATDVRTVQFQPDGSLHSQMRSPKVEHLLGSEITLLSTPDLLFYQGYQEPWHINSRLAEISPDGKQVELIDNVHINHQDEKNGSILITSARMMFFPEQEYATSDVLVRIQNEQGIIQGIGMQAWLKESRLNLLSTVRGQYEAP